MICPLGHRPVPPTHLCPLFGGLHTFLHLEEFDKVSLLVLLKAFLNFS